MTFLLPTRLIQNCIYNLIAANIIATSWLQEILEIAPPFLAIKVRFAKEFHRALHEWNVGIVGIF